MKNVEACESLFEQLCALGVAEFCVCAGSRNAPLTAALLAAPALKKYFFVEERLRGLLCVGAHQGHGPSGGRCHFIGHRRGRTLARGH